MWQRCSSGKGNLSLQGLSAKYGTDMSISKIHVDFREFDTVLFILHSAINSLVMCSILSKDGTITTIRDDWGNVSQGVYFKIVPFSDGFSIVTTTNFKDNVVLDICYLNNVNSHA